MSQRLILELSDDEYRAIEKAAKPMGRNQSNGFPQSYGSNCPPLGRVHRARLGRARFRRRLEAQTKNKAGRLTAKDQDTDLAVLSLEQSGGKSNGSPFKGVHHCNEGGCRD